MRYLLVALALAIAACGGEDCEDCGEHENKGPCPDGTQEYGVGGLEWYCGYEDEAGSVTKHGPYVLWKDGYVIQRGQHEDGLPSGCWVTYQEGGQEIKSEGCYSEPGMKCGKWLDVGWDPACNCPHWMEITYPPCE